MHAALKNNLEQYAEKVSILAKKLSKTNTKGKSNKEI